MAAPNALSAVDALDAFETFDPPMSVGTWIGTGGPHEPEEPEEPESIPHWIARITIQAIALVVQVVVLAALVVAVLIPRVGSATPYTIETGSMAPHMPPGTLVVVRPTDTEKIAVGTVVTFQLRSGDPTVVTHRVVAVAVDGAGRVLYQTKGDANTVPDAQWVRPVQIRGTKWYAVRELGRVNTIVNGEKHALAAYAVVAGLFGYAVLMYLGIAHGRARRVARWDRRGKPVRIRRWRLRRAPAPYSGPDRRRSDAARTPEGTP